MSVRAAAGVIALIVLLIGAFRGITVLAVIGALGLLFVLLISAKKVEPKPKGEPAGEDRPPGEN